MSEEGRPRRDIARVNYVEPGDNPESTLESSGEVVDSTAASADASFASVDDNESFASVRSSTAVVASVDSNESFASHTTVIASVHDSESFPSVESRDTVLASVGESVGEPLLGSSPKSSVVEEEASEMASSRANQLVAELEAVFFQLEEIKDDVDAGLETMSSTELNSYAKDLKDLRVQLVKANQELNLLTKQREYDGKATQKLADSKVTLNAIKGKVSAAESMKEKDEETKQRQAAEFERRKIESKIAAFKRSCKEIDSMYVGLNKAYTAPSVRLTREQMLKRHQDVPALASEFDSFRERVDRLINQTEVVFVEKEKMIDEAVDLLGKLEQSKVTYEKRSYDDIVANDLT